MEITKTKLNKILRCLNILKSEFCRNNLDNICCICCGIEITLDDVLYKAEAVGVGNYFCQKCRTTPYKDSLCNPDNLK